MEATYKATELAAQSRPLFGTTPEVVSVALREAGKKGRHRDGGEGHRCGVFGEGG